MLKLQKIIVALLLSFSMVVVAAPSPQDKADMAVANILFDFSIGDEEYASYRIDEYGYAHVTFAENTPDPLYSKILNKMQQHPDIRDVIPDKGGPSCKLF